MSVLKQVEDVGATLAWYPELLKGGDAMIALGTKEVSGGGFDDYGASLEIHKLDLSDGVVSSKASGVGKKSSSRFCSLTWHNLLKSDALPMGLVAGGMSDGCVDFWDPSKIVAQHPNALAGRMNKHTAAVNGLQFNPHPQSKNLLASGGADSQVLITTLDRPDAPRVYTPGDANTKHTSPVTKVAWNSQVVHILATSSQNGACIVWDLRAKRAWCELRDSTSADSVSDVCWNPAEGLHIATASGDDQNPVIRLWDLRASTTMPLGTLKGHTQGILSMSWCPDDTSLLASCARDNKTLVWDFFNMQPVYDMESASSPSEKILDDAHSNGKSAIPSSVASPTASDVFGGGGGSSSGPRASMQAFGGGSAGRRYQVAWSPSVPAVLATCSFDRKVQVFSMAGAAYRTPRGPAWLRRPAGASFGFGGKLASFKAGATSMKVTTVVENRKLIEKCERFEQALASTDKVELCASKASVAASPDDKRVWDFMRLIFEPNAREQLLACLGYDVEEVAAKHLEATATASPPEPPTPERETDVRGAADVFGAGNSFIAGTPPAPPPPPPPPAPEGPAEETEHDAFVKRALLVGNFEAAVESCLASRQLADALLLASCGGAELWEKTRMRYFEIAARSKRPFLDVVSAIITNELDDLVARADLSRWEETLAVVSTYGKSEDFPGLCEQLGKRLEDANLPKPAALCYMCAVNVPKTLEFWVADFRKASDRLGKTDVDALQELVERVAVFARDADNQQNGAPLKLDNLGPELLSIFADYANLLAGQGMLDIAAKYCAGASRGEPALLLDRLNEAAGRPQRTRPYAVNPLQASTATTTSTAKTPHQRVGGGNSMGSAATSQQQQRVQQHPQQASSVQQRQQPGSNELPAPWVAATDPASGRTYYANTQTGVTQWEVPQAPAAQPAPVVQQQRIAPRQQQRPANPTAAPMRQQQQPVAMNASSPQHRTATNPAVFRPQTSTQPSQVQRQQPVAQQPQPAQYQQPQPTVFQPTPSPQPQPTVFQPQPQPTVFQPQQQPQQQQQQPSVFQPQQATSPMAPAASKQPSASSQQPPVSAATTPTSAPTPEPAAAPQTPANPEAARAINDGLAQLRAFLDGCQMNGSERRQIAEIDKGINKLAEKLANGNIADDVVDQARAFVEALQHRDFASASSIQVGLVNSVWTTHKDWIKNFKFLQQLLAKKAT